MPWGNGGDGEGTHLLLDAAAEVLLDELPAGGRLQLQVRLQGLGQNREMAGVCDSASSLVPRPIGSSHWAGSTWQW